MSKHLYRYETPEKTLSRAFSNLCNAYANLQARHAMDYQFLDELDDIFREADSEREAREQAG